MNHFYKIIGINFFFGGKLFYIEILNMKIYDIQFGSIEKGAFFQARKKSFSGNNKTKAY